MIEPQQPEPTPVNASPPPVNASIPLLDATRNQCRWLVDERTLTVCGAPGNPWCSEHRAKVYQPHKPKRMAI